jgi:serine/threonine-protein kinase
MGLRPRSIGPYRIESRLGAGGMGEVFRAWDERLERWVAVKVIRPEAAGHDRARERFRREARAAAGLSHPAIVQIFDILEWEEGDAIVMEWIDGETLSRRIAAGPLPLRDALRLGREVAEGLAAAHAKGLVHRDLKPENVMVTPDGHAKILDFGLAKRWADGEALTRGSAVVGTFRSMSPEQARGLPFDHRSDLFSFGTLLYEALTGRSPFESPSTLDTLTRICSVRPEPLAEVDPAIPEPVSRLVDHLMEKDPALRPQSTREVAAALEGMAGLAGATAAGSFVDAATWVDLPGSGLSRPSRPPLPRPSGSAGGSRSYRLVGWREWRWRWIVPVLLVLAGAGALAAFLGRVRPEPLAVAVTRPRVASGSESEQVGLLASGLRVALLRTLTSLEGIAPLAPDQVDTVDGPPGEIARATAADEVLTALLSCGADACQISLARISGRDGSVLWAQSLEAPIDRPDLAAEAVESHLRLGYPDHRVRAGFPRLEVAPADYAEFLRVRDALREGGDADAALARLAALRGRSSRFLEGYIYEADVLRYRFSANRDPADLRRASDLLGQAREMAPADPRPLFGLFEVALAGQDLDRAERALTDVEELYPGSPELLTQRARLLELRGARDEALSLMRQAARRRPFYLFRLADMEYRLGEEEAARAHLRELLERVPAHRAGLSLLAQLELLNGSPEKAAELYTRLVRQAPRAEDLVNLGLAYVLLQRYPSAEERFRQAVELDPNNPLYALNLADVVLLRRQPERAAALYRRVLELVEKDPAASHWQLQSTRAQALARLGEHREAVEVIQRVLPLAQNSPQAAYEVSLVYVLVGDRASALVNAERALRLGVEPAWFRFPWFDSLRTSAEFQDLLTRPASTSPKPA